MGGFSAAGALGSVAQSLGSILVFLLLLSLMVVIHELGHFITAKLAKVKVEEFGFGFPPRIWGVRRGETLYSINALPLGGFVRMLGEEDPTDPRSFARASKLWRFVILEAGSSMNFLLAVVIFGAAYAAGWPTVIQSQVQVIKAMPGLPAAAAGIHDGDFVLSMADVPVTTAQDVRKVAQDHAGQTVPVEVRRDGQVVDLSITPRASWPQGEGPLGISVGDRATKVEPIRYAFPSALARGAVETVNVVGATFSLPVMAMKGILPWSTVRPVGPVGIYSIASQAAVETVQTGWWFPILSVAGSLSAGLGLANLLPIPGLDGGRLVFVVLEIIRRRRVSPEREGMIHLVGMAFLFSLVIFITFIDISAPLSVDFGIR